MEQKLEVTTNGQYKNIGLKTTYERDNQGNLIIENGEKKVKVAGIEDGNYIIVTKKFAEGKACPDKGYGISYICAVEYEGEDVGFFLKDYEHDTYKDLGGVGDKVKISLKKEMKTNKKTGAVIEAQTLSFEQA